MQESTIKSNFAYMRLLCGLLLFNSCRNLKPYVSLCCRGRSFFCFNSGLTVAFSHSSKLSFFFLALFKLIPTKLTHFQLLFQDFCSFKNLVHKQISNHWIQTTILEFTPWHLVFFKGEIGSLVSIAFKVPVIRHNRATNLAFLAKKQGEFKKNRGNYYKDSKYWRKDVNRLTH